VSMMSNYPVFLNISFFLLRRHYILLSMSISTSVHILISYSQRSVLSYLFDPITFFGVFFLHIPLYLAVYLFGIPEIKN